MSLAGCSYVYHFGVRGQWAWRSVRRCIGWFIIREPDPKVMVAPDGCLLRAMLHTMVAYHFLFANTETAQVCPMNIVALRNLFTKSQKV